MLNILIYFYKKSFISIFVFHSLSILDLFQDFTENEQDTQKKTIVEKSAYKKEIENKRNLSFYFQNNITKQERNLAIKKAYNHGHSQVDISKYLKLSESSISKIVNC